MSVFEGAGLGSVNTGPPIFHGMVETPHGMDFAVIQCLSVSVRVVQPSLQIKSCKHFLVLFLAPDVHSVLGVRIQLS